MIDKPVLTPGEAAAKIDDGAVVSFGGFLRVGAPHTLIDALLDAGASGLTLIVNDAGLHDKDGRVEGVAKLTTARRATRVIASHIGTNVELQRQLNAGETEVDLVPQGTLIERIRCAGFGLGGVLTPVGLGTEVEKGKQVITFDGKAYLLEVPLRADVALVHAKTADRAGNLVYNATARNFNPIIATAARLVIAEVEEIVETGAIDPNHVHTPGLFVDALVLATREA